MKAWCNWKTLAAVLLCLGVKGVRAGGQTPHPAFPVWTASAGQTNAQFGISVASAGDVNGDGHADIIVGASKFTQSLFEEGAAFVFHGAADGPHKEADWSVFGGQKTADFGICVAPAGDVNRDGFADVIVGAPGYTFRSGEYNVGAAFVYLGSSNGLATAPFWTAKGVQPGDLFGECVAGAGDLNGDGYPDVIVGAPNYREDRPPVGKVFVWYGSAQGFQQSPDWTFTGDQRRSRFGQTATRAGDVNGDGYDDVIIAARDYDADGLDNAGKVWVFHGSPRGLGPAPDWTLAGWQRFGRLGSSCAAAGDVNRDGFGDVLIGASGQAYSEEKEGAVFVFLGSPKGLTQAQWRAEGNRDGVGIGLSVCGAGDVNGDGFADILVGAPTYNAREVNEGRVFGFHGSPRGPQTNTAWVAAFSRLRALLGRSLAGAGDVNKDGFDDVVVGIPMEKQDAEGGMVRVYAGSPDGLLPVDDELQRYPILGQVLIPPRPPFWQETWFWGGAVVLLAAAGAAGWHLVTTARLKRQLRFAEQARLLEQERLRIAQDLHDHLGANLTTISMLSDVARRELHSPGKAEEHLDHITRTARDLTRALEEIVWAVNPRKNRLDQLVSYFSAYAEEFLKPTELRCRLHFPDELPEITVAPEIRHGLFLVFKEALTNIVKHAAADEVRISLTLDATRLALMIEDNGRGFDSAVVGPDRNGLANMRSRIEKLGGRCTILGKPGKGTRVHLEINLARVVSMRE